jgi:hypothetical protein
MPLSPAGRALARLGVVLLGLAAVASVAHVLASQSPTSALWLGVLPGPVQGARDGCALLGAVALAVAPHVQADEERRRGSWMLVSAAAAGTLLVVASLVWGAASGMPGLQLDDPRPLARWLVRLRLLGGAALSLAYALLARQIFRKPR